MGPPRMLMKITNESELTTLNAVLGVWDSTDCCSSSVLLGWLWTCSCHQRY